jgi:hypothetical protein
VSFAAITLCVASQRMFIVVYFVIDSVRKFLDILSYVLVCVLCKYAPRPDRLSGPPSLPSKKKPGTQIGLCVKLYTHPSLSSAEITNIRSFTSIPTYVFVAWCFSTGTTYNITVNVSIRILRGDVNKSDTETISKENKLKIV